MLHCNHAYYIYFRSAKTEVEAFREHVSSTEQLHTEVSLSRHCQHAELSACCTDTGA